MRLFLVSAALTFAAALPPEARRDLRRTPHLDSSAQKSLRPSLLAIESRLPHGLKARRPVAEAPGMDAEEEEIENAERMLAAAPPLGAPPLRRAPAAASEEPLPASPPVRPIAHEGPVPRVLATAAEPPKEEAEASSADEAAAEAEREASSAVEDASSDEMGVSAPPQEPTQGVNPSKIVSAMGEGHAGVAGAPAGVEQAAQQAPPPPSEPESGAAEEAAVEGDAKAATEKAAKEEAAAKEPAGEGENGKTAEAKQDGEGNDAEVKGGEAKNEEMEKAGGEEAPVEEEEAGGDEASGAEISGVKHDVERMEQRIARETKSDALAEMLGEIKLDLYRIDEKVDGLTEDVDNGVKLEPPKDEDQIVYPISTTMRCIIMLTVQYFVVYTAAAVVGMAQSLLRLPPQSRVGVALNSACDTMFYAPMLCVLFLGARLRALQITENKGSPQDWAQQAMMVCSWAILVQTLLVLGIPLFTNELAEVDQEHGGLKAPSVDSPAMAGFLTLLRYSALMGLYCGTVVVCSAILLMDAVSLQAKPVDLWDDPTTAVTEYAPPVSPAVACTIVLSCLFFLVYLAHAALGSAADLCQDGTVKRSLRGWLSTLCLCQKAVNLSPMLCVLFIAARMRALQVDPKNGNPQGWAHMAFYVCTGSIVLQVTFIVLSKVFGAEPSWEDGQDELQFEVKSPVLRFILVAVRYMLLLALYIGLGLVIMGVFTIKAPSAAALPPVSPALNCTIMLTLQYFFVTAMLFGAQTLSTVVTRAGIVERAVPTLQNAERTVKFAPMLAVLFIGTRMRALELSDQRGSPQCWAQDAMFFTTFALLTQLVLTFLIGTFVEKFTMDSHGNPEVKLQSVVGAGILNFIKAATFVALYGGAGTIVVSVLVIRPETAVCPKRGGLLPQKVHWPEMT